MARRINYGYEKSKKEAERKKKQAAKLEKKRLKKEGLEEGIVPADGQLSSVEEAEGPTGDELTQKTD